MYRLTIFFSFIFTLFLRTNAELFTSIADLQRLFHLEQNLPDIIDKYIDAKKAHLEELKGMVDHYRHINATDIEKVSNPINAFLLIKSLSTVWRDFQNRMKEDVGREIIAHADHNLPQDEDLDGAAIALLRLQDTYRLDTTDLANGLVQGKKVFNQLTAHDCFEIARRSYNHQDYYHTLMWMQEALDRSKEEVQKTISEEDALEYLAFSLYKQGNLQRALVETEKLVKLAPHHKRARDSLEWYEEQLEKEGWSRKDMRKNLPALVNRRPPGGPERDIYEALCRGEVPVSPKELSRLYCYLKRDRPFLLLAPIKVEIMRFNPLAVMFRGVVHDSEISVIQDLARPRLNRATAWDSVKKTYVPVDYRISKSAWLKETDHEVIANVNSRIHLMTNLDLETAEELQIANYGIGGHYDPHFDFATDKVKTDKDLIDGNRVATVLFYLSQPELGGATVFTDIKTTNWASKNDALFWYNLYRSGDGDMRTRHAACPVLLGVKWVANKWIHERGQEWGRYCGLSKSVQEKYIGDLGAPEPRYHSNLKGSI